MNDILKIELTGASLVMLAAGLTDFGQFVAVPICLYILGGFTMIFGPLIYGIVQLAK